MVNIGYQFSADVCLKLQAIRLEDFIQELAVMFIRSQVKAQDFASLSMRVSYRETKAGQLEHKTILKEAKKSASSFRGYWTNAGL